MTDKIIRELVDELFDDAEYRFSQSYNLQDSGTSEVKDKWCDIIRTKFVDTSIVATATRSKY